MKPSLKHQMDVHRARRGAAEAIPEELPKKVRLDRLRLVIVLALLAIVAAGGVMAYRRISHDYKAMQGEWETVSTDGNGPAGNWLHNGEWLISNSGHIYGIGGRSRYDPLSRSVSWENGTHGTYELNGNSLKIRIDDHENQISWTLRRVR
jgi:hypothetical protein